MRKEQIIDEITNLQNEWDNNQNKILDLHNKLEFLNANTNSQKSIKNIVFSLIPLIGQYFLLSSSKEIANFFQIHNNLINILPITTLSSSLLFGKIFEKIIRKTPQNYYSGKKNEIEKQEEIIKYETEYQYLTSINENIENIIIKLQDEEQMMDYLSEYYQIYEKENLSAQEDIEKNIQEIESLLLKNNQQLLQLSRETILKYYSKIIDEQYKLSEIFTKSGICSLFVSMLYFFPIIILKLNMDNLSIPLDTMFLQFITVNFITFVCQNGYYFKNKHDLQELTKKLCLEYQINEKNKNVNLVLLLKEIQHTYIDLLHKKSILKENKNSEEEKEVREYNLNNSLEKTYNSHNLVRKRTRN